MTRQESSVKDEAECVRMGLSSQDIKTLYYSNEKYVREMIEVCAHMSERERLIILTIAKTLAVIMPEAEENPKPVMHHRKRDLRDGDHAVFLHGVA